MYNKHYWTKLGRELNEYVEKSTWSRPRTIQIEHTGFFSRHIGFRGLNHNESKLLDFGTRLIEANAVHFAYSRKYNSVNMYIQSTVHSQDAGTYIEFTRNGKLETVTLYDGSDRRPRQIVEILGGKVDVDLFQEYSQDEFKTALVKAGCNVLVFFRFNAQVGIDIPHHNASSYIGKPNYIKTNKRGIEIGYMSHGTYNSLPSVISIKRVSTIQSVKLVDLGIERKGYYSHDCKCLIPKSQAKQAKRFFAKRFKAA